MNYLALLVSSYLALTSHNGTVINTNLPEWHAYKQQFGKTYESAQVESLRRIIFASNKQKIDDFNRNQAEAKGFSLKLNQFADMTDAEIKVRNGFRIPQDVLTRRRVLQNSPEAEKFLQDILNDDSIAVPDSVDWRNVPGRVTRVRDEGDCGASWAFAATGALEGQQKVRSANFTGELIELSVQNLIDCSDFGPGCDGGLPWLAFNLIKSEGGIDDATSYPYTARNGKCKFSKDKVVMSDTGGAYLTSGDEDNLKQVVAKFGPVAIAVDADSHEFQFYHKGVFSIEGCKKSSMEIGHAALVVGYGTDPKEGDYWILKNMWGTSWGQDGYMLLARNKDNMCGVATEAIIPTF